MKKLISLILALALCCLLIPAVAEEASITGTWYLSRAQSNGVDLAVIDPEMIILTFSEDGTCAVTGLGAALAGTWALADGVVTITPNDEAAGDATSLTLADGELVFQQDAAIMYLSQTPAEGMKLPEAVAADSLEAFDGTWVLTAQIGSGLYGAIDEAYSAAYGKLIVESGKGAVWQPGAEGNLALMPGSEFDLALLDGKLCGEGEPDDYGFVTKTEMTLREDGSLYYTAEISVNDIPFTDVTYVFVRDAAAEEPAA